MLDEVIRELKRPVSASPDLDARIMAQVLARPRRLWWAGLAVAAGLALIAWWPRGKAVPFKLMAPQATTVAIVGDFNNWKPTPLVKNDAGAWETRVRLAPGQYNYVFVVDGKLVSDPAAPKNAVDDFGSPNSVVTVAL